MTHLSVNLNKIALLRNSRGKDFPSVKQFARKALDLGVYGLTLHPRPDERHARFSDLPVLKSMIDDEKRQGKEVELNIEGYPSAEFLEKIEMLEPDQCTLVPDPPDAITSDAGWNFTQNKDFLLKICQRLKTKGIRSSLFLDPFALDDEELESLSQIKPDRIEFYTEKYAVDFGTPDQEKTLRIYQGAAGKIVSFGIDLNAGHDLNQKNLSALINAIPAIKEVSIGHALIVESLLEGFDQTVTNYLNLLRVKSL